MKRTLARIVDNHMWSDTRIPVSPSLDNRITDIELEFEVIPSTIVI